jgi:hypothetical protein
MASLMSIKLVLILLRAEARPINQFERIAQGIAALEPVYDLGKNFSDFVFDRMGPVARCLKPLR